MTRYACATYSTNVVDGNEKILFCHFRRRTVELASTLMTCHQFLRTHLTFPSSLARKVFAGLLLLTTSNAPAMADEGHAQPSAPEIRAQLRKVTSLVSEIRREGRSFFDDHPPDAYVSTLCDLLSDDEAAVRHGAVLVMRGAPNKAKTIIPALVKTLKNDENPSVRCACVKVLSSLGDGDASLNQEFLLILSEDPSALVRAEAAQGIRRMKVWSSDYYPLLIKGLRDRDKSVRVATAFALVDKEDSKRVVSRLLHEFVDKDESEMEDLAIALSFSREDVFSQIRAAIASERSAVRAGGILTLGKMASRDALVKAKMRMAVDLVSDSLGDSNPLVRRCATRALWHMVDERSLCLIPSVLAAIHDEDEYVRIGCCEVLVRIGSRRRDCIAALESLLQDPVVSVREQAVEALGRMGPAAKSAVPRLMRIVRMDVKQVRLKAAEALGGIGKDAIDSVPTLKELMRSEDEELRKGAKAALERIEPVRK